MPSISNSYKGAIN